MKEPSGTLNAHFISSTKTTTHIVTQNECYAACIIAVPCHIHALPYVLLRVLSAPVWACSDHDVSVHLRVPRVFVLVVIRLPRATFFLFFFNDTATTEIYTLSLHDALPI